MSYISLLRDFNEQKREVIERQESMIEELADMIEVQREKAEQGEALIAENQRLLTEKAIKQNWSIGLPKPPNENSK
jgi:hypothetical protein